MTDTLDPPPGAPDGGRIIDEPVEGALSQRYLAYALSTITARALPDVRDGLKPVQRRILYAMRALKLDPNGGFKKCAKIVGEVMGNYHPHGDQAIYDALARMAQDFSMRARLVDGQGNFGNIDGDPPAAMRYTEARLTPAAQALLQGLDEGAVDFRPTFDEQDEEPAVLAAAFPNLLVNGASGIAVGMATSIPPHNPLEMIDAARVLAATPDASLAQLLAVAPGPDAPTGGVLAETPETIAAAYETGRGGLRLRARWEREDYGRGQWRAVVTEIPYQLQKSKLVERMAALLEAKKLPLIGDIRDESAEDVRLVIEPKSRTVEADLMMESLFRQCDLETRLSFNLNVLDAQGAPRVMGLKACLRAFLDHKREVLQRRARWRLGKIADRLEILAGYLIAYLNIDEVIAIIRTDDHPKDRLMTRFGLSERQAEAVLNMRLRALRKLEEMEIRGEDARLREEQTALTALLADERAQWARVDDELGETRALFAKDPTLAARRTQFSAPPVATAVTMEALTPKEALTVVLSAKGWIRALRRVGPGDDSSDIKYKDGDGPAFVVQATTLDRLIVIASDGRAHTLAADKLPGGRGGGEPVRLHADLPEDAVPLALFVYDEAGRALLATRSGQGFLAPMAELVAHKRAGRQVVNLGPDDAVAVARAYEADAALDHVAVVGSHRKLLIFPAAELPTLGRGKGVRLQAYRGAALAPVTLADAMLFRSNEGFAWRDASGRRIACETWRDWLGKRAQAGKAAPKGFPRSGRFGA